MATKAIVTEDYSTSFENSEQSALSVTLTKAETNVKIDGQGVFAGTITVTIAGFAGTTIKGGAGTGTIKGDSKTKVNGNALLLDGTKSGTITCVGTTASGSQGKEDCVVIVNAGQTNVKAD